VVAVVLEAADCRAATRVAAAAAAVAAAVVGGETPARNECQR
jgi:hypothetical protein